MKAQLTGSLGENIAGNYLESHNYKIIKKNYHSRFGEIDLIARDNDSRETVFVEVKTRKNTKFGYPEESLDARKFEKIWKTAKVYMSRLPIAPKYRFDCLAINIDDTKRIAKVRHIKNIDY